MLFRSGQSVEEGSLTPIQKIDAFGLKNLARDIAEFEKFADSTGVPQLADTFNELKTVTHAMLDKELPTLLQPENAAARRRKSPVWTRSRPQSTLLQR